MSDASIDDIVSCASLLRILTGVLVATKFPDADAEAVREWIRRPGEDELSFVEWLDCISPPIFDADSEAQQHLASLVLAVALLRQRSRQQQEGAPCTLNPTELSLIWTLIHNALLALPSITVTRSSQGFLAVPLCSLIRDGDIEELFRFHVWLPDGERGNPATAVHAHQPYARSWVLAGQGRNFSYRVEDVDDCEAATHAKCRLGWSGSDGSTLGSNYGTHHKVSAIVNSSQLVRLHETDSAVHGRDETYSVPAGAFHRSSVEHKAFHATLFYFDSSKGFYKDAPVLGPKDGTEYLAVKEISNQSAARLARLVEDARLGDRSMLKSDLPEDEAISMTVDQT